MRAIYVPAICEFSSISLLLHVTTENHEQTAQEFSEFHTPLLDWMKHFVHSGTDIDEPGSVYYNFNKIALNAAM